LGIYFVDPEEEKMEKPHEKGIYWEKWKFIKRINGINK